ncbi:hypothetical protein [Halosolutus halophilus]|uniref:hypothetical protein n=1 Tax=Halosolutus halophilus TaxID=1552990 RepID=UPI00223501ED|nr:hypothetical protein [Halosolutus halophilus]
MSRVELPVQTDTYRTNDEAECWDEPATKIVAEGTQARGGDPLDPDPLYEGAGVSRVGTAALRDDADRSFEEASRR